MPRVTHVKKAQKRYETKPVLDPETGEQKQVPVMNSRTGEQKTSKSGRPVFMKVTERDLDRPLPMPVCDYCHEEIKVGSPYKWIEPSGQRVRNRHADCPTWNVWDYSSSLSARIAQIQHDDPDDFDTVDDLQAWAAGKAEEIRGLAEEKRESAQNIEDGFGHATYQSDELNEQADSLEQWAYDLENADIPEIPEPDEEDCEECDGTGEVDGEPDHGMTPCEACDGSGTTNPEEPSEEQMDNWRGEALEAVRNVLDEAPC